MKPCTTSALTARSVTGMSAGTRMHLGTNAYCSASTRTVTASFGETEVPRFVSENSPPSCTRVESMVSTLDGSCIPQWRVVNITIASSAKMMAIIDTAQTRSTRRAVRSAASWIDVPGCVSSANCSSRQEDPKVEGKPHCQHRRHGQHTERDRSARSAGDDLIDALHLGILCETRAVFCSLERACCGSRIHGWVGYSDDRRAHSQLLGTFGSCLVLRSCRDLAATNMP